MQRHVATRSMASSPDAYRPCVGVCLINHRDEVSQSLMRFTRPHSAPCLMVSSLRGSGWHPNTGRGLVGLVGQVFVARRADISEGKLPFGEVDERSAWQMPQGAFKPYQPTSTGKWAQETAMEAAEAVGSTFIELSFE
jgi:hypothetical protein